MRPVDAADTADADTILDTGNVNTVSVDSVDTVSGRGLARAGPSRGRSWRDPGSRGRTRWRTSTRAVPRTTWSSIGMPSASPASLSRAVAKRSSGLGVGSPDGWLCATTTDVADNATAGPNTSRGCTGEESHVPTWASCTAIGRFLVSADHGEPFARIVVQEGPQQPYNVASVANSVGLGCGFANEGKANTSPRAPFGEGCAHGQSP